MSEIESTSPIRHHSLEPLLVLHLHISTLKLVIYCCVEANTYEGLRQINHFLIRFLVMGKYGGVKNLAAPELWRLPLTSNRLLHRPGLLCACARQV